MSMAHFRQQVFFALMCLSSVIWFAAKAQESFGWRQWLYLAGALLAGLLALCVAFNLGFDGGQLAHG